MRRQLPTFRPSLKRRTKVQRRRSTVTRHAQQILITSSLYLTPLLTSSQPIICGDVACTSLSQTILSLLDVKHLHTTTTTTKIKTIHENLDCLFLRNCRMPDESLEGLIYVQVTEECECHRHFISTAKCAHPKSKYIGRIYKKIYKLNDFAAHYI